MEDILASIRSMIADDEPEPQAELAAPPPVEAAPVADSLVDDMMSADILTVDAPVADTAAPVVSDPVPVESVSVAPTVVEPVATHADAPDATGFVSTDMLDIDSLFDGDDLSLDVGPVAEPMVEDPADSVVDLPGGEDMDLVKSLMAELSEEPSDILETAPAAETPAIEPTTLEPVAIEPSTLEPLTVDAPVEAAVADLTEVEDVLELDEGWFSGELTIPESVENAPVVTVDDFAGDASEEPLDTTSMLDEILMGSLDAEETLNTSEAAEAVSVAEVESVPEEEGAPEASNVVSLSDIAAQAERDAEVLTAAPATVDYTAPVQDVSVERDTPADVKTAEAFAEDIADDLIPMEDLIAVEPDAPDADSDPVELPNTYEPETSAPETEAELAQALEEEVMARTAPLEEIIDDEVEVEASSAFAQLNRLVEEKAVVEERGPRIGDLVAEALKPMLKEWLDENLKGIVERAVQKEVKRISSGK